MFQKGHTPWHKNTTGLTKGKKLKKSAFQKGSTPWNKGIKVSWETVKVNATYERMESKEYDLVVKPRMDGQLLATPDCEGNSGLNHVLRPTPSNADLKKEIKKKLYIGMNNVDNEELMKMINNAIHLHMEAATTSCQVPFFDYYNIKKWGICWRYQLNCVNCNFITPEYRMYKTIPSDKRGPDPGAPNVALALGLQETAIGNVKAQHVLSSMNCPPPSRSSMQRTSNNVAEKTIALNKVDMANKLEIVKSVNRKRGVPENEINITVDARYSSNTIISKKRPGQNANQAIALGIETVTDRKYIVATASLNRLCWTGAWLRGRGYYDIECPGGHEECTANLYRVAPLSEYELGKQIGTQLAVQGILVKYATTDGDGTSASGINDAVKALYPMWEVERLADPIHLGQGQFRAAMRAKFSDHMFHGKTKEQKRELQKNFSLDVKCRSAMVVNTLMERHGNDVKKVSEYLPNALEATLKCYDGDCSMCAAHSIVCKGGDTRNWWNLSIYLSSYQITALQMEESDKHLLLEILKMKLSTDAINSMRMYDNTNKNEATHRSISASLPKNVNFSRNMEGRLASTVHRSNNNPGTSTRMKCESLGINLGDSTNDYLDKLDRDCQYQKEYQKTAAVKQRKIALRAQRIVEYKTYKEVNKKQPDYRKGQLDPVVSVALHDHTSICKKRLP